jgi:hypothetical protein
MNKIYSIFVVVSPERHAFPATATNTVTECRDRATVALGASWAELERQGYRIHRGHLTIGEPVASQGAEVQP